MVLDMSLPPPVPSVDPPQLQTSSKTSVAAVWSLVFGVSSFCTWLIGSIPALILGSIALSKINKSQGQLQGKGLAIAGLVTGGIGTVVGLITMGMMAGIMIPAFVAGSDKAKVGVQENEIQVLVVACHSYAGNNGGKFPDELQQLYPDYINDESLLKTRSEESQELEPYMYFSGKTVSSEPRSLLIASPVIQSNHYRVVGFCDSSAENILDEEFYRLAELESL